MKEANLCLTDFNIDNKQLKTKKMKKKPKEHAASGNKNEPKKQNKHSHEPKKPVAEETQEGQKEYDDKDHSHEHKTPMANEVEEEHEESETESVGNSKSNRDE